jgi:hypothetical protein
MLPAVVGVPDVALVDGDAAARKQLAHLLEILLRPGRVARIADGDRRSLVRQQTADGRADTGRSAGDQRHPVADMRQRLRCDVLVHTHACAPISDTADVASFTPAVTGGCFREGRRVGQLPLARRRLSG